MVPAEGGGGSWDSLASRLHGELLEPGTPGYDEARAIWNSRLDRRPAAVLRCTDVADVIAGVDFARERGLLLAIRGGGHDYAGNGVCEGGLVLDLSPMNAVRIDAERKRARVDAGATWAVVDRAAQEFGLATTAPAISMVGVAGSTLGGGSGHLSRSFGLCIDNLVEVEMVTAAGELVRANDLENPDLFWGLRGGGANLGVATAFEFALHDVGTEILGGMVIHPLEAAEDVLRAYRDFMADADDAVVCLPFFINIPPVPDFPETLHGETVIALVPSYVGGIAEGEEALRPLRDIGDPILDWVIPQPYLVFQQAFDAGVGKGNRWYSKAHYLDALTDDAIEVVLQHVAPLPGPLSMVYLEPLGGAVARVDPAATAFPHRGAAYSLHILPGWMDPATDDEIIGWARTFHEAMAPFSTGGVYVNLLGEDERGRVPAAYGENYERLVALKSVWDPGNLFRVNQNIEPSG
jgi:FAD/FMN-containing dehydrogenase